jgi:hypothetical protein
VSFPDADMSTFEKPSKVQELQASLACTLRLPLEKIRIESITLFDSTTGIRTPINIDPSLYSLRSQAGEIGCLEFAADAPALRRLQAPTVGQQVDVNYLIVAPPPEILMLNASEFAAIIETSPSVASMAASVGSTGVISTVTVEQYAGIQTSSAQQAGSPSTLSSPFPGYGIGLLSAGSALIVLSAAGVAIAMHNKAKKRRAAVATPAATAAPTRHVQVYSAEVVQAAPNSMFFHGHISQNMGSASTRTMFNPVYAAGTAV